MKNNTINYPYIKPKRIKSVINPRSSLNLTKNNTINSQTVSNLYNSLNKDDLSKIGIQRLQTDYSIIPQLYKEKINIKNKLFILSLKLNFIKFFFSFFNNNFSFTTTSGSF